MVSFMGGFKEAKQMNYCEGKERQIRSKQMQEIQTLNDRNELTVAGGVGHNRGNRKVLRLTLSCFSNTDLLSGVIC